MVIEDGLKARGLASKEGHKEGSENVKKDNHVCK